MQLAIENKITKRIAVIRNLKGRLYRFFFVYLIFGLSRICNDILRMSRLDHNELPANKIKRILIIHTLSIGDTVVVTPLIRAIKEQFPKARLIVLISPVAADILKSNPFVDEILLYEISNRTLMDFIRLIKGLRRKRFDLVLDSQMRFMRLTRTVLPLLTQAPYRVGFKWDKYRGCLNNIEAPLEIKHGVEQLLDLAKAIGIKLRNTKIDIFISESDRKFVDTFLSERQIYGNRRIVMMHPGNIWQGKRWSSENFAKTADHFILNCNMQVIITGNKDDLKQIGDITSKMTAQPLVAAGLLSVGQLCALIERTSLLICIDTCVVHIAAGLNVKTIALYGQSYPRLWHPWNHDTQIMLTKYHSCGLCKANGKSFLDLETEDCDREYACINGITVSEIKKLSEKLLAPKFTLGASCPGDCH